MRPLTNVGLVGDGPQQCLSVLVALRRVLQRYELSSHSEPIRRRQSSLSLQSSSLDPQNIPMPAHHGFPYHPK